MKLKAVLYFDDFKRLLNGTKDFVSDYSTNMLTDYIRFKVNKRKNEIEACGLDGHRISVEKASLIECDKSFEFYIKPFKIQSKSQFVEIEVKGQKALITIGEMIYGFIQGDDVKTKKFPDADKYIKEFEEIAIRENIGININFLKDALKCIEGSDVAGRVVEIEVRSKKDPLVINTKNGKRYILPVNINR